MAWLLFLTMAAMALPLISSMANAATVEHTFHVRNLTLRRVCKETVITAVNGQLPGPTLELNDGDTVVVHVVNESPYDITIHWHGIFQFRSGWADGASMITQCPIRPGNSYTHRFNVTGQEGTLWWHAHVGLARATVYGALIIRPKGGVEAYPFPKPDKELAILLGEWWAANLVDVKNEELRGIFSNISDAFTINGEPGDLYNCSTENTYKLEVESGKTYLLRIVNAALNNHFFFKVAGHSFTVVATDASYNNPYKTDVIVIAPGQTVDALMVADAPPAHYYIAARPFFTERPQPPCLENTTTRGVLRYASSLPPFHPTMPTLPNQYDTATAYRFYSGLTSLPLPGVPTVPLHVDERLFITVGFGSVCHPGQSHCPLSTRVVVSTMSNISFTLPAPGNLSILEAEFEGLDDTYFTTEFPEKPPLFFNFTDDTNEDAPVEEYLEMTRKATSVKRLAYGSTVEMVLQGMALVATMAHPIHIHGHNFFVVGMGFGNYDPEESPKSFNLVDPQVLNTFPVPPVGWAVIRFVANNPGAWLMHCHAALHLSTGMGTVLVVGNGPTQDITMPPPPSDLPKCSDPDANRMPEKLWSGDIATEEI